MKRKCILAALVLSLSCPLFAQNKYNMSQFWSETGDFFRLPARWDGSDVLKLGVVSAATLELHQYDGAIQKSAHRHSRNADTALGQVGEQWGGFIATPVLGFGLLAYGSASDSVATKKVGFEIIQSVLYAESVSLVLKTAIGRARPGTHNGPYSLRPFSFFRSRYNAFPAGHVDAAFSMSTVFARSTDSTFLKVLAYVPAGFTFATRLYKNEHWASDCLAGAALGYYAADWVVDQHEKKSMQGPGASGLNVRPYLSGDALGLMFTAPL